jgi:hypothetical protein
MWEAPVKILRCKQRKLGRLGDIFDAHHGVQWDHQRGLWWRFGCATGTRHSRKKGDVTGWRAAMVQMAWDPPPWNGSRSNVSEITHKTPPRTWEEDLTHMACHGWILNFPALMLG